MEWIQHSAALSSSCCCNCAQGLPSLSNGGTRLTLCSQFWTWEEGRPISRILNNILRLRTAAPLTFSPWTTTGAAAAEMAGYCSIGSLNHSSSQIVITKAAEIRPALGWAESHVNGVEVGITGLAAVGVDWDDWGIAETIEEEATVRWLSNGVEPFFFLIAKAQIIHRLSLNRHEREAFTVICFFLVHFFF